MVAERRHVLLPPGEAADPRPRPERAERTARAAEVPAAAERAATDPQAPARPGTGSTMLIGLKALPGPLRAGLAVAALVVAALVVAAVAGGDGKPATTSSSKTKTSVASTTVTSPRSTTTTTVTTTAPEVVLITGERPVLAGPPRGGLRYGTAQIAKAGTKLVAPEVSTGSLKATSWQWVLCGHGTKDCEPVADANKARWTVTRVAAGNDVRVRVGLGSSGLAALSSPVFVQVG
jgi:hypothetical protein